MKFIVNAPATTANLGPGFDTLGLALDLWNETTITRAEELSVRVHGEGNDRLPSGKNNLLIRAAQRLADRARKPLPAFHADCVNRIPLSSGLGSSAATIVTGLLAANVLLENRFPHDVILDLAAEMEGHPDNVAPALMGGLMVSTMNGSEVTARRIPIGIDVHITIALPDFYPPTRQARAALPKRVPIKNAIHNISRAVLVTEAFRTGDLSLLANSMNDRLHQPYRLKLIPGAASAMDAAKKAGAAGVALSGAGPGVIAFSSEAEPAIGESMQRSFEKAGLKARIFNLKVSSRGAEIQSTDYPDGAEIY